MHSHANSHKCIHEYMHRYTCANPHAHTHPQTRAHTHAFSITNICTRTHTHTHLYTHTHTHTHTHTPTGELTLERVPAQERSIHPPSLSLTLSLTHTHTIAKHDTQRRIALSEVDSQRAALCSLIATGMKLFSRHVVRDFQAAKVTSVGL